MPVIDAHTHLGACRVFDLDSSEDSLTVSMDENGIDISLVQPYPGAPRSSEVHDRIFALSNEEPGRFFGIASINPHQDQADYFNELERCVKKLGFVGVKLHTIGHAVNPAGADGTLVFESASQLGIPVMVHTGPGIPFAAPSSLQPQLERFPNVKVIMAHAGHGIFSGEAVAMGLSYPQVYMEPSWCAFYNVAGKVEALGVNRVMFGSDLPPNIPIQVDTFKALGLSDEDEEMVMGGAAKEVFQLDI